jgi:hypothetical protein
VIAGHNVGIHSGMPSLLLTTVFFHFALLRALAINGVRINPLALFSHHITSYIVILLKIFELLYEWLNGSPIIAQIKSMIFHIRTDKNNDLPSVIIYKHQLRSGHIRNYLYYIIIRRNMHNNFSLSKFRGAPYSLRKGLE